MNFTMEKENLVKMLDLSSSDAQREVDEKLIALDNLQNRLKVSRYPPSFLSGQIILCTAGPG